jgi:dihydrofolate synthase/folylpolyglutamate synthase
LAQCAATVGATLWQSGSRFPFFGRCNSNGRWHAWPDVHVAGLAYPALRGANQLVNAAGVLAALDTP